MTKKTAVVAIGGNSLIRDKMHQSIRDQYIAAHEICGHVAALINEGWNVVIVHGNGPQVGFILRRSELAAHELHEVPLDVCGADTQGALGYALQQNLYNYFYQMGIKKSVATVVTQVEVSGDDPAFENPTKPIGSFMDADMALRRQEEGWTVFEDAGRGWRRVVPSPLPIRIVEEPVIKQLIDSGVVVIAVGGGGIPVVADEDGNICGVAAVIDKDQSSALLAINIEAELLVLVTSVEKVALNYGQPNETWLDRLSVADVKQYLAQGKHFAEGSMAPKMRAVVKYLAQGQGEAIITNIDNIERAINGETGTRVSR